MIMVNSLIFIVLFATLGFLLGILLKRSLGIFVLCGFFFAALKALEMLGKNIDWAIYHALTSSFSEIGRSLVNLLKHIMDTANVGAVVVFVLGGVAGIVLSRRS